MILSFYPVKKTEFWCKKKKWIWFWEQNIKFIKPKRTNSIIFKLTTNIQVMVNKTLSAVLYLGFRRIHTLHSLIFAFQQLINFALKYAFLVHLFYPLIFVIWAPFSCHPKPSSISEALQLPLNILPSLTHTIHHFRPYRHSIKSFASLRKYNHTLPSIHSKRNQVVSVSKRVLIDQLPRI